MGIIKETFKKLGIIGFMFLFFGVVAMFEIMILYHYKDPYWFGPSLALFLAWGGVYATINNWWE